jgi:microcystin-dependent protein
MAFIIPNAVDTTSGNKYVSLDQAEPDSIDFEILGNGNSGVVSGCEVSPTPVQGGSVAVSEGSVVINGQRYSLPANTFLVLPAPPTTIRFDLIVARLSGSTVQAVALFGSESSTNPSFPKSKSTMVTTVGANVLSYVNPDTDVVLAAVYRYGSTNVVSSYIMDKRRIVQSAIVFRGTVAPTATQGSIGDIYLRTGSLNPGESGVYVKQSESSWVQFGNSNVDPGVPVGTVITWVAPTAPNGAVWLECNGQPVSRYLYSSLFGVLGTTYGSGDNATTFNLPDFRGIYLSGMPVAGGSFNSAVGNTNHQVLVTTSNMPEHTHSINHGHSQVNTGDGGEHTHSSGTTSAQVVIAPDSSQSATYVAPRDNSGWSGTNANPPGFADGYTIDLGFALSATNPAGLPISKTSSISKSDPKTHTHSVSIPTSSGLNSGGTGQVSPTPLDIRPRTMYVKYYIRCA